MFSTNNTYGNPNVDKGWYESNGCRIEAEVARGCKNRNGNVINGRN